MPRRATPAHVCNASDIGEAVATSLAPLLDNPEIEAGFRFVRLNTTDEIIFVQGVLDEETGIWEYKDADGNVVDPTNFKPLPVQDAIYKEYCDSDDETVKYLLVMCKVDGVIDPTKNQWVNLSDNSVSDTKPATAVECVEEVPCVSIPIRPMVDEITVAGGEDVCDEANRTMLIDENFDTPSDDTTTTLGAFNTQFDFSVPGSPPFWGQLFAEGVARIMPAGFVPVDPSGTNPGFDDIHNDWVTFAPYSTGYVALNMQASTGANGQKVLFTDVDLTAGKCYTFAIKAMDVHTQEVVDANGFDLGDLGLVVNGNIVDTTGPIAPSTSETDGGVEYTITFMADTTGTQELAVISNNAATAGNDIFIDYVRLYEADIIPALDTVTCVEFQRETVKCPDGTYTEVDLKDGAPYTPQGTVRGGYCELPASGATAVTVQNEIVNLNKSHTRVTDGTPTTVTANYRSVSVTAYSSDVTIDGATIERGQIVSIDSNRYEQFVQDTVITGTDYLVTTVTNA